LVLRQLLRCRCPIASGPHEQQREPCGRAPQRGTRGHGTARAGAGTPDGKPNAWRTASAETVNETIHASASVPQTRIDVERSEAGRQVVP
jgi:hypothetical protein